MSEEDDALREMAANRGARLQKSRRRKPGGDFGRFGLKDARTGVELFGYGPKGLTATADDIRDFLRGGTLSGWKSSLRGEPNARRREAKSARQREAEREKPKARPPRPEKKAKTAKPKKIKPKERKPKKEERPLPELVVREARPKDAAVIAHLIDSLGYPVHADDVRRRVARARKRDEPLLVAERGEILGCLSWHVTPVLHRPRPVGRITMMVVAQHARGQGIGSALVEAAESRLRNEGCGLIEVTSNIKRLRAHHFYQGLGFERTSYRFVKPIRE